MPSPARALAALARGGVLPALATPFDAALDVDADALGKLAARALAQGCAGVVVAGTTGEAPTLSEGELGAAVRTAARAADGRGLVLAGVGTNDTRASCRRAVLAADAGADALLVVTPYYNRPTQDGLRAHVRAIAGATDLPLMLYDVPGRTAACFELDLLAELATLERVAAYKDATGDLARAQALRLHVGDGLALYAGDDALALPFAAIGAVGLVSVTANALPGPVAEAFALARTGPPADAWEAHARLLPVHRALFAESSPGPLKALLARGGHGSPALRPPLVAPREETVAALVAAVRAAGLEEALR
ncbi:MAG: 4-hydroxy-tetrahydrodipicolinate synthase [Myxococcota bacterium]